MAVGVCRWVSKQKESVPAASMVVKAALKLVLEVPRTSPRVQSGQHRPCEGLVRRRAALSAATDGGLETALPVSRRCFLTRCPSTKGPAAPFRRAFASVDAHPPHRRLEPSPRNDQQPHRASPCIGVPRWGCPSVGRSGPPVCFMEDRGRATSAVAVDLPAHVVAQRLLPAHRRTPPAPMPRGVQSRFCKCSASGR